MENLVGKVIDNYRIVSVLGKGGMGIVYKAYDTKLDRFVAIKLLGSQVGNKERFIERFKREAKNHAQLSHPNIVTVYGFIEYSNLLGIVMEYVEGESLEKVLERQGRFNLYDVIYLLKQILLGIGYAHSKGFIHRDVKPSNIILNKEGVTKIMDFGISKSLVDPDMTKTGSKIGTVYYMSPEQVRGEEVTNRSDIYSIGCTVYEMIAGEPPFDSQSEYEVMDSHLKKTPQKLTERMTGIPEQVDSVLHKALQKNPNDRYSSCEEMFNDVQELDKDITKIYSSYFIQTQPRTKKYKLFSVSAFVGFSIILIALSYFVFHQVRTLITTNEIDKFKKYSIQTLFDSKDKKFNFSAITKVPSGVSSNLNSIFISNEKFAVAVGDSGTILTSNDVGSTWVKKSFNRNIAFSDIYTLRNGSSLIVGDSSSIYLGFNSLDSLKLVPFEKWITFFRVKFFSDNNGFIAGNKGTILKSNNAGHNWYKTKTNSNEIIFDLAFFDAKRGFAVGWNATVLATLDGGESWHKIELSLTDNYLKSIDLHENGYGLIVGGDGTILRTTDFGNTWEKLNLAFSGGYQKVKFISEDYCVIVGSRGAFLVSKDKGETWNLVDSHIYSNLNGFAVDPFGKIFLVGVSGTIYKIQ